MGFYGFVRLMAKILEEKYIEYKNSWRELAVGELREKMNKQLEDISTIIMKGGDLDKKRVRRMFVHVAIYCFFIHHRMGEKE